MKASKILVSLCLSVIAFTATAQTFPEITISSSKGHSKLSLRTCAHNAGAICSLVFNGKEFIDLVKGEREVGQRGRKADPNKPEKEKKEGGMRGRPKSATPAAKKKEPKMKTFSMGDKKYYFFHHLHLCLILNYLVQLYLSKNYLYVLWVY